MKKLIFLFAISIVAIGGISMMSSNEEKVETIEGPTRTCEYRARVDCGNSKTWYETVRAPTSLQARTIIENRYPNCKVGTAYDKGNCKY
ncbi:MAG: hypothetical protein P8I55_06795 [Crocinitomix sp.]|nr:hypothetical protein [Crocinitomix sp.]